LHRPEADDRVSDGGKEKEGNQGKRRKKKPSGAERHDPGAVQGS